MKPMIAVAAVAALLAVAPGPCFALWGVAAVTKENFKEYGAEVRSEAGAPDSVRVELEFPTDGPWKGFRSVDLRIGGDNGISAPLKEDRSKERKVVVSFSTPRADLDKIQLWVMVPPIVGARAGGTAYDIRLKDFVEAKK